MLISQMNGKNQLYMLIKHSKCWLVHFSTILTNYSNLGIYKPAISKLTKPVVYIFHVFWKREDH